MGAAVVVKKGKENIKRDQRAWSSSDHSLDDIVLLQN